MKGAQRYIDAFEPWLVGKQQGNGEWRAYCPVHEDPKVSKSSSASLNFEIGLWHCASAACGDGGSIRELYKECRSRGLIGPKAAANAKPRQGKAKPDKDLPTDDAINQWVRVLLARPLALKYLSDERGINKATIRQFQIGWDGQRYTIPVRDEDEQLVNVRRYKPKARQTAQKMISWGAGWGEGRLLGHDILKDDSVTDVILTEGELDYILARQYGLPSVTHTAGANVFKNDWAKWFIGKRVFVAYDDDKAGDMGAVKVAKVLKNHAAGVYRLRLDTGIPGGDVTDYFVKLGGDAATLLARLDEAKPLWEDESTHIVPQKGRQITVEESQSVEYDEPLQLTVVVAGKQTPPFIAPQRLRATCTMAAGPACNTCPMSVNSGQMVVEVPPDSEVLLKYINSGDKRKHDLNRAIIGAKCSKHVEFDVERAYSIEELVVQPSIEHRSEVTETPISRKVYNVGTYKTPVNQAVKIVGKQTPDPNTQRGTFMGWLLDPVRSDIDTYQLSEESISRMMAFRPAQGESVYDKCMDIAGDMANNVTHIYGRDLMHMALDLVWHSVIAFEFAGKALTKGWLECLIIGDTRTGKSEAAHALISHYQAGILRSCEGATFAGLVGGAQKMGRNDQWMVTWGVLPLNDRRLVVLDEMSGLMGTRDSKGILENMSSIRSEGKAEITKIAHESTSARTRIVWISNPMDRSRISDSPDGSLNSLRHLVRNPEDIARFDYVLAVANNEVDAQMINSVSSGKGKPKYTGSACAELVLWAWSRKADDVRWAKGAEDAILAAATDVGNRYVADPPLVQVENIRIKLARLSVAFAARTFSSDSTGKHLIVRKAHVKAAVTFLDQIYSTEAMGYAQYSRRILRDINKGQENAKECEAYLLNNPELLDVLRGIGGTTFRPRDFEEQAALDRESANMVVRKLIGWKMIRRLESGRMRIQASLSRIMKEIDDDQEELG